MKTMIERPGIFYDFDIAAYFDDPCPAPSLSQSIAKTLIDQSPRHAALAHPRLEGKAEPDTDYNKSMAIGNVAHKLLLGRGQDVYVAPFADFRTKAAQIWKQEHIGKNYITAEHYQMASELADSASAQLLAHRYGNLFTGGKSEVVVAWEENGIWLRTMMDYLTDAEVVDLKTVSGSAAPHAIPYLLADQGWDIQAAMHERALNAVDPVNAGRRKFIYVAVEQDRPYGLTVNQISEGVLEVGRQKLEHAINIWRECMAKNEWPMYPPILLMPEYPGYKLAAWQQRAMEMNGY